MEPANDPTIEPSCRLLPHLSLRYQTCRGSTKRVDLLCHESEKGMSYCRYNNYKSLEHIFDFSLTVEIKEYCPVNENKGQNMVADTYFILNRRI